MKFKTGSEIVSLTQSLISAKKQQGAYSIDLTVRRVSAITAGGSLDFGGSEYSQAAVVEIPPEKRTPDEPYGWWKLEAGAYLVNFNEKIGPTEKGVVLVLPHERLVAAGAAHAPVLVQELDDTVCVALQVGSGGLAVKENARISKAVVIIEPIG